MIENKATGFDNPDNYWIRWLLLLPCAVFGYGFILTVLQSLFAYREFASWVINYIRSPIISFLGSVVFILIGVLIAPKSKKTVGLILLVIIVMISSFDLYTAIQTQFHYRIVRVVSGLLGGLIAYKTAENMYK
jgi:hypothetical protein